LFSDEPYLWTAFVKVDGDTLVLDLIGDRPDAELTEEDLYLRGRCSFVAGSGSHGNLGGSDVDEGEDVAIPSTLGDLPLGEFGGTLKPIPLTDRAKQKLRDRFPEISIPDAVNGTVAVVVVLADENSLSDAAAEAGHATFNTALERELNGFLFQEGDSIAKEDLEGKLGFVKRELSPEDKARIKAKVKEAVEDAIVSSSGGGLVDPDAFSMHSSSLPTAPSWSRTPCKRSTPISSRSSQIHREQSLWATTSCPVTFWGSHLTALAMRACVAPTNTAPRRPRAPPLLW